MRRGSGRNVRFALVGVFLLLLAFGAPGLKAEEAGDPPAGHGDAHAGHRMSGMAGEPAPSTSGPDDGAAMEMGGMQGGKAPEDARDPHEHAGGQDFGPFELKLGDTHNLASLLAENFEAAGSDGNTTMAYDLQGWYGGNYNRLVVKAEGDLDAGRLEEARTEILWSRAVRPYWDAQVGLRYDSGEGPERSWLAVSLQGLAPYWFEVDITGYLGESGRTALRFDIAYELLLTQRWILQPNVEADVYGRDDPERGIGSGLSSVELQLRLRYELRREFAPYVGIGWVRKFGETRDLARQAGGDASEFRVVAGLRFWF